MKTPTYCANCGRPRDHRHYDLCAPCRHISAPGEPTEADALIDGEWVQRGPIKVWQPAPPPPIVSIEEHPDLWRWGALGPCPTCGVEAMQGCVRPSGERAWKAHAARLPRKRVCQTIGCGEQLTGHHKQRYCPACAVERKKASDAAAFKRHLAKRQEAA